MPSSKSVTPTSTKLTISTIFAVQTTNGTSLFSSTSTSTTSVTAVPTQSSPNSLTEKHSSGPPVYAIILSVILPLIILAIFGIAIVIFLMYIRLYIKHNKEKPSTSQFFIQL